MKENATKDAAITLKSGHTHGDLMTANSNVTLAYGEENKLTLAMARKVMMLESVTINNVPAGVTAVAVSVSPLHKNITLDGSYSGDGYEYTATLAREGETDAWKSTGAVYLLEASGSATVKVSFTAGGKIHSYSYLCPQTLAANHKVNISGAYSGDGVTMTGTITGATWDEPINITFSFNDEGETETVEPGEDGDGTSVTDGGPAVGSLYQGCYVLDKKDVGGNMVVTLMSPKRKLASDLGISTYEQSDFKSKIETGIGELSVSGISGWRLPSLNEMEFIKDNFNDIHTHIQTINDGKGTVVQGIATVNKYFFRNSSADDISIYGISSGDIETPSNIKSFSNCVLRAFTTITIQNK